MINTDETTPSERSLITMCCVIVARIILMKDCNSFPGKYRPVPQSRVTEIVCNAMQPPPNDRKVEASMNFRPEFVMLCSAIQPFDNSNRPAIIAYPMGPIIQANHLWMKE